MQTKPFKSALHIAELDHEWSFAASSPFEFKVLVQQGTTRRAVGAQVHRAFAKLWKSIELEAQLDTVAVAENLVSPSVIDSIISDAAVKCQLPTEAERLGITPPASKVRFEEVQKVVTQKYVALHADFERSLQAKAQQAAADVVSQRKLEDQIAETSPHDLFNKAVEAALVAKLEDLGIGDVQMAPASAQAASKFIDSLDGPKKYESPSGGVGQSSSSGYMPPQPKAKAKGKGKGKQGRGEPNSWPSGPSRGKKGPRQERN